MSISINTPQGEVFFVEITAYLKPKDLWFDAKRVVTQPGPGAQPVITYKDGAFYSIAYKFIESYWEPVYRKANLGDYIVDIPEAAICIMTKDQFIRAYRG